MDDALEIQQLSDKTTLSSLSTASKLQNIKVVERIERLYKFVLLKVKSTQTGWLFNMHLGEKLDDSRRFITVLNCYFIGADGSRFKVQYPFHPFFYVGTVSGMEREVIAYLRRKYSSTATSIEIEDKEDLDMPDHLIGLKHSFVKIAFYNIDDLNKARQELHVYVNRNKTRSGGSHYQRLMQKIHLDEKMNKKSNLTLNTADQPEYIVELREYDVPYVTRVAINCALNVGCWYDITIGDTDITIVANTTQVTIPTHSVIAFDIETTKLPLRFPDPAIDEIMMISIMFDGVGYLINNRQIISTDVADFEYTPRPEYPGIFTVFNEKDENSVLLKFIELILDLRPLIFVTYNGDFFDWPFIDTRCQKYDIDLNTSIGFTVNSQSEYRSCCALHMDAIRWVRRDSYLPIGSQGLKAVTRNKLRYNPDEIDPEDMCRYAVESPQVLANYSVSDAVATYYLYMKYVHPFIFALAMIIPLDPCDVLSKGSGTLCEALLMSMAFKANVIFPNKQLDNSDQYTPDGHLLEAETYVGATVEAIESGVFRSDLKYDFSIDPDQMGSLIDNVDRIFSYAMESEGIDVNEVENLEQATDIVKKQLICLREKPKSRDKCSIYHLDIAAMYPNIILTNRLQPSAIVKEEDCAMCSFNGEVDKCRRPMTWTWRGDYLPATRMELQRIRAQLEKEKFDNSDSKVKKENSNQVYFRELHPKMQRIHERKRYTEFCRNMYKRIRISREEKRQSLVCQRENSFYVDVVRAFRDRRYEYKGLHKQWQSRYAEAGDSKDPDRIRQAHGMVVLYDSLQLAHKCILNSFYGYVMRKGARWYSMEMAGIVCFTGSSIITDARKLIEKIGRPLELDTDGIWCALPQLFPGKIKLQSKSGQKAFSFPCAILNLMLKDKYTNAQYHQQDVSNSLHYDIRSENSITFEVDGPYLAMILPAAREEGKIIKKRYCVFNYDKSVAELKGFEMKRNGELQLIKVFQEQVFETFLKGNSLEECYNHAGAIANYWLDVLYSQGCGLSEDDLLALISEKRKMSRSLEDYSGQKSHSISTAKRLSEFLGEQIVKDKGLQCCFVIAKLPNGLPVTERAIPVTIFKAADDIRRFYLRRWMHLNSSVDCDDARTFIDWGYYIERLGSCIQKIITIPACFQGIANPVPRVSHPPWLKSKLDAKMSNVKQRSVEEMFANLKRPVTDPCGIEQVELKRLCISGVGDDTTCERGRADVKKCSKQLKDVVKAHQPYLTTYTKTVEGYKKWKSSRCALWLSLAKATRMIRKGFPLSSIDVVVNNSAPLNTLASQSMPAVRNTLDDFIQSDLSRLMSNYIQVIEIIPPDKFANDQTNRSLYEIIALAKSRIVHLSVKVKKVFLVNRVKEQQETPYMRLVSRILPRSHHRYYLYEYNVDEQFFFEKEREIMAEFDKEDIRGVYELSVPTIFRTIVTLGCCCKISSDVKDITKPIPIKRLDFLPVADYPYLEHNLPTLIYLYIFTSGDRMLIGVALSSSGVVYVIAVDGDDTSRENRVSTLSRSWKAELTKRDAKQINFFEQSFEANVDFRYRCVANVDRAMKLISSIVTEANRRDFADCDIQSIVVMQSHVPRQEVRRAVPELKQMPIVSLPLRAACDRFGTMDGWQKVACQMYIKELMRVRERLSSKVEQARYFTVPAGNLPEDFVTFGIDVFFARHLLIHNHSLWSSGSRSNSPFGNRFVNEYSGTVPSFGNSLLSPKSVYNEPNFYTSNCLQLQVKYLAIAALVNSDKVNVLDGVEYAVSFDKRPTDSIEDMMTSKASDNRVHHHSFVDSLSCSWNTINILRSAVASWMKNVSDNRSPLSELPLSNFYRWVTDSTSLLYDPFIREIIELVMGKLMTLLISELGALGARVVHASPKGRVVVNIKRHFDRADQLEAFVVNSLIKGITEKNEMLRLLFIYPTRLWQMLYWYDEQNFCGVQFGSINPAETQPHDGDPLGLNSQNTDSFSNIIGGYVLFIFEQFRKFNKFHLGRIKLYTLEDHQNNEIVEQLMKETMNQVQTKLRENITTVAFWLRDNFTESQGYFRFGPLGKVCKLYLYFIHCICELLSVHSVIENEIQVLRESLYQALGHCTLEIAESGKALIQLATASFPIGQMYCRLCLTTVDFDLYSTLTHLDRKSSLTYNWKCPKCSAFYDKFEIEARLCQFLRETTTQYALQDVKCNSCGEVKESTLEKYCRCNGQAHVKTLDGKSLAFKLALFEDIANIGGIEELQSNIQTIKRCYPNIHALLRIDEFD